MTDVVGYEAAPSEGFLVAWGAAAIRDEDSLVNPATGMRVEWSDDEVKALEENGDLVLLPKPLPIGEEYAKHHLVVLQVAKLSAYSKAFHIDTQQAGGIVGSHWTKRYHFYVFENDFAFDQMAHRLCTQIVTAVLSGAFTDTERDRLIEAGLILDSYDPFLNALRVWFSPRRPALRQVVSGKLSEFHRERFDQMLGDLEELEAAAEAETETELARSEMFLKYQNGVVPPGGGLNVPVALRVLHAMNGVSSELQQIVSDEFPFIEDPPPLHVQSLVAASAEFHFAPVGESLGEQLSRLIQLRYLSNALEGKETRIKPTTLARLTDLGGETNLSHKPIGQHDIRGVNLAAQNVKKPRRSEPFQVLGYQSGLVNSGKRVEITIFPGRRFSVGTTDNGDGDPPLNLAFLETSRDFLFRPTLYTLVRSVDERGREVFHLRDVRAVRSKFEGTITALPSAIVPGAFIFGLRFRLSSADGRTLQIGVLGPVDASSASVKEARSWLGDYRGQCLEYELSPSHKPIRRMKPPKHVATAIGRVVVSLQDLGGSAPVTRLVTEINARYDTTLRVNNTRREALFHPDLLEFDDHDPRVVRLTDRGILYATAYRAAGGGVGVNLEERLKYDDGTASVDDKS
ncbi:MAG: hypothetical protein JWP97_2176 [Labilithrix sp.]|nr:hypothetical protein [Labilithrix sp.]